MLSFMYLSVKGKRMFTGTPIFGEFTMFVFGDEGAQKGT
jgi:hypothetical protein